MQQLRLKDFLQQFMGCLDAEGIAYAAMPNYASFLQKNYGIQMDELSDLSQMDMLISLGGDGTVLDTLSIVKNSGLPVLGVNLGRFGFLANTTMLVKRSRGQLRRNSMMR